MTIRSILLIIIAVALFLFLRWIKEKELIKQKSFYILTGIFFRLAIFILVGTAILFPGFKKLETTGIHQVKTKTLEVTDENRREEFEDEEAYRSLSLDLYYPSVPGGTEKIAPLVVFSHGGMGIKNSNVSLYEELASHGYFVVSIDHTYHALFTDIGGERIYIDRGYLTEINGENPNNDIQESFKLYQKWMKLRTDDIGFVIDYFTRGSSDKPEILSLINSDRVGVIGHSLGGAAALGMPRLRDDIDAVIALESPFMVDILGVENGGFLWNEEDYSAPMLNIYSDSAFPILESDVRYAQNKRYLFNDEMVEYYHIEGSNHFTLIDLSLISPMICRLMGGSYDLPAQESLLKINQLSVEFLDKHMK